MRAPVYRNLDALTSIGGLALPYEAGLVGLVLVLGVAWLPIGPTLALVATLYTAIRLGNRGHHPGYLQDLLPYLVRRSAGAGRFSSAARARPAPSFPFAPRLTRDAAPEAS